jgi:hypothetical protein
VEHDNRDPSSFAGASTNDFEQRAPPLAMCRLGRLASKVMGELRFR